VGVAEEEMENNATELAYLRRFVVRLVGNETLADDIVQETLLRAHRANASFSGQSKRETWLAAIALNVTRDHYRRASAWLEQAVIDEERLAELPSTDDTEHALMEQEMAVCVTAHLMALPDRQREVLALHDIKGADHAEMATVLGISEGNARVLLHRAREALRTRLREHCHLSFGSDTIPCAPLEK
jgi:RNA polymerase sigma-70 factor (ECF subfamily)